MFLQSFSSVLYSFFFFHRKIMKITILLHKVLLTNLIVILQMQIWGFNLELLLSFNCISFTGELVLLCNLYNLYNYGDFCSGNHRALDIIYLNFSIYLNIFCCKMPPSSVMQNCNIIKELFLKIIYKCWIITKIFFSILFYLNMAIFLFTVYFAQIFQYPVSHINAK